MGMFSLCSILCLQLFLLHSLFCCFASPSCRLDQSSALLDFKNSLSIKEPDHSSYTFYYCDFYKSISYPKTSTWENGTNCCLWNGVTCNTLGHVIALNLNCSWLQGKIHPNSSLFQLTHLQRLDLGLNDFQGSHISSQIAQLVSLRYLSLCFSYFSGEVPFEISHLHKLVYLDLRWNNNLSNPFKYDYLSFKPNTWKRLIKNLTDIRTLYLSGTDMSSMPLSQLVRNLSSSLVILWLDSTRLQGNLDDSVPFSPYLQQIGLADNMNLTGYLPKSNWSNSLKILELSSCRLAGKIPASIWNLTQLTWLGLSNNNFFGQISSSISNLQHLSYLDLSSNNFNGEFPRSNFSLENLIFFNLSDNFLTGNVHHLPWKNIKVLDLSSNMLQGELNMAVPISATISSVSHNNSIGGISSSICNASSLEILDLSDNKFYGPIPQCIGSFSLALSVLDLQMNCFSGTIPKTFEVGNNLRTLHLNGNLLEGSLPQSLVNCTKLKVLDVGRNCIEDTFPHWLQTLEELQVLILSENKLHGSITNFKEKTNHAFPKLRVFDLSSNNFTGPLPATYFNSFKAMINVVEEETGFQYMSYPILSHLIADSWYLDSIELTIKGLHLHLEKILTTLTYIDLSNNMFEGEIPQLMGELGLLIGLNLSHNGLIGAIPKSMGNLRNLEWLDLSSNKFTGKIPLELTNLNFIEVLNLSQNQLEGCIPRGKQFETFTSDSFKGNRELHGFQVSSACNTDERRTLSYSESEYGFEFEIGWKAVVLGYGCGAIFGMTMGWVVY